MTDSELIALHGLLRHWSPCALLSALRSSLPPGFWHGGSWQPQQVRKSRQAQVLERAIRRWVVCIDDAKTMQLAGLLKDWGTTDLIALLERGLRTEAT